MSDRTQMDRELQQLKEKLVPLDGPFIILGRPHSGTRSLAHAFSSNGFFMGKHISPGYLDSWDWFNFFVLPLINSSYFPNWPDMQDCEAFRRLYEKHLSLTLRSYLPEGSLSSTAWGWKLSETLFLMPLIKKSFPRAKFIHLIRDGRDVVLSDNGFFQLTSKPWLKRGLREKLKKIKDFLFQKGGKNINREEYRRFCLNITFGRGDIKIWRDIDLADFQHIVANRYLLQMQSWCYCIETARRFGQTMPEAYLEVHYEEVCREPLPQLQRIIEFLGQPIANDTQRTFNERIHTGRIGKWKTADFDARANLDFERAVGHGSDLLKRLGYNT